MNSAGARTRRVAQEGSSGERNSVSRRGARALAANAARRRRAFTKLSPRGVIAIPTFTNRRPLVA